jgi:DNA polymerase I-like protein with 3'-5' exonuclease and polymerase domains
MKSDILITVYSEQDLTPKAVDTIREIVDDGFPDHSVRFKSWTGYTVDKLLVFGSKGPGNVNPKTAMVYTYSIAQIMTKANAATVLKSAIRQFIDEPEPIPFGFPRYTVSAHVLTDLNFDKPTAIDIETSGDLGGEHTPEEVEVISVAFYQEGRPPLVLVCRTNVDLLSNPLDPRELRVLAEILPRFTKPIYHNGKFDVRVLERVLGVKLCVWFDTMLAHHVLNQAAGDHKLKHLAKLYLGAPDWEEGIGKFLKGGAYYENIPREYLVMYNGMDVYWTYKLYELFAPQIEADENASKAFYFELQVADFLLDVEKVGIPFDIDYAGVLGSELQIEMDNWLKAIQATVLDDKFNPGSHVQIKKYLAEKGYVVSSTDEDHINELMSSLDGLSDVKYFCHALLMWRKAKKMHSTYVKGWWKHARNGRVHPTFLVHGTSTGRLSSTGPNAQNVPRDKKIRKLVALRGYNNLHN